ncbi:aquaporin-1-like [Halichoeres trimaculatus]|uniref:aquaporin-1-like n=1 Tax=Halichoeres trimaculatus TaxID=147232 RepID=UPI003D9ECF7B
MSEFKSKDFWRAVLAELVGMTLFIFLSLATAIGNTSNTNPDQEVKVALGFGLSIATLAQSLGHISGAHLNPAVTFGMLTSCQISLFKAVMYIIAQMLGSALGNYIMFGARPSTVNSLGLNSLSTGVTPGQGVGIELLATFQLVLCVIAVTDKRRRDVTGSAPLAIGLSVCLGHLAAISYTGCGINPARSFGPALILNDFTNHWVYWVGPMCGGVAAALMYDFFFSLKFDDFPERMKVLVSGPAGKCDINEGNDTTTVEVSPNLNDSPEYTKVLVSGPFEDHDTNKGYETTTMEASPKFSDFPESKMVLVSGQDGDYDLHRGNNTTTVEGSLNFDDSPECTKVLVSGSFEDHDTNEGDDITTVEVSPKVNDFPESKMVLVSGPFGDYDVHRGNDDTTVEVSPKFNDFHNYIDVLVSSLVSDSDTNRGIDTTSEAVSPNFDDIPESMEVLVNCPVGHHEVMEKMTLPSWRCHQNLMTTLKA